MTDLTPAQLVEAIERVDDLRHRTILCHPGNFDALDRWLDGYEYKRYVSIIPSPYVSPNQLIMFPTKTVLTPEWLRR